MAAVSLNLALALVPTKRTATKQVTMIRANMTAYSTAVGPSSSFKNATTFSANFFISISRRFVGTIAWKATRRQLNQLTRSESTACKQPPSNDNSSDTPRFSTRRLRFARIEINAAFPGNPAFLKPSMMQN